jgi:DNA polymerase III subunit alpha
VVKIVAKKSLGIHNVFDIGVSQDHNFLLTNGLVASNCFNKSHSMAYGYVTFQTAYLKANYPVEYMAAILTLNSGEQEKVQRYIATCMSMGIKVLPPDINRSGIDFTPIGDSILFGLSAVRNVGMGAIEAILEVREKTGNFKSLADLCDQVDSRALNRRALEALIHCGAFDSIEKNRHQLAQDLELVMDWAQSRAKDRASGQGSLFDLLGGGGVTQQSGFESAPKGAIVEDYPSQQKLQLEKEVLGFYISDHPLKQLQDSAKILAPVNLGDLKGLHEGTSVSAIALITTVKNVTTKKGDAMAIIEVEDLTGKSDAVVFPRTYDRIGNLINPDARLMVWGKIDKRDTDQVQLIIEDAEPIETVHMVMVELDPQMASDAVERHRLKTVLQQYGDRDKAKVPVVAIVSANARSQIVRFGSQFRVKDGKEAAIALEKAGFKARVSSLVNSEKSPLPNRL